VIPVLVVALTAVSAAAVLVRLAPDVHPIAAALWRTLAVGLLLAPGIRRVPRRDGLLILLAGACLAAHFWAWFASLHLTSVVRSTVLVCLNPIWAGLLEWRLGERPERHFWIGVGVAVIGVAVMSGVDGGGGLVGDGLALLGGVLGAVYLVVGRGVRQRVSIRTYGPLLCLAAAGWLALAAAATGAPLWGFSPTEWGLLAAMALGPQLLGHIGLNYAVGYVPAAIVSALLLLEPVGAGLLAWVALGEAPGRYEALGGGIILVGIGVVTLAGLLGSRSRT